MPPIKNPLSLIFKVNYLVKELNGKPDMQLYSFNKIAIKIGRREEKSN